MSIQMQQCGKIAYPSPRAAWRAIRLLASPTARLSHKRIYRRTTTYRCATCHSWHITHWSSLKRPTPLMRTAKYLNNRQLLWEDSR